MKRLWSTDELTLRWALSADDMRLRRVAEALGPDVEKQRGAGRMGLRYLLAGGCAYVILKYTATSLPAALAGLFVPVAAVIIEILIELVYARN